MKKVVQANINWIPQEEGGRKVILPAGIRYHDLRHSCASLLLSLGYSMKDIQEWLGHSNYQTTANLYSHVDPRNKAETP